MSKRLRSSFRPGKARSVRPRAPGFGGAGLQPELVAVVGPEILEEPVSVSVPVELVELDDEAPVASSRQRTVPEPPAAEAAQTSPETAPSDAGIDLARTQPIPAPEKAAAVPEIPPVEVVEAAEPVSAIVSAAPEAVVPEMTSEPGTIDLAPESIPTKKSKIVKPAELSLEDEDGSASSLSLSAEFFREEEDSVPPFVDSLEIEEPLRVPPPSPETIARRARFRRVVGAVVAFAGLVSVAVVGKTLASSRPASASVPAHVQPAALPVKVAAAPVEQKPAPEPEAKADKPAEPAPSPEPAAEAQAEKAPEPVADKPGEAAEAKADKPADKPAELQGDATSLKKEALALMNRGKLKDAIPVAQAAIAADPSDALSYLYLGSALQDTGKWKDGIEAYSECVRNATKGPVHECRAMGGKK